MSTTSKVQLSEDDYRNLPSFLLTTLHFLLRLAETKKNPHFGGNDPKMTKYNKYLFDLTSSEKYEVKFINNLINSYKTYAHDKSEFINRNCSEILIYQDFFSEVYHVYKNCPKNTLTYAHISKSLESKLAPFFTKHQWSIAQINKLNVTKEITSQLKGDNKLRGQREYAMRGISLFLGAEPSILQTLARSKNKLEEYLHSPNFDDDSLSDYQNSMTKQAQILLSISKNILEIGPKGLPKIINEINKFYT